MKNIILCPQCKSKADFLTSGQNILRNVIPLRVSFSEMLSGGGVQGKCWISPAERGREEGKSIWGGNKETPGLFLEEEEKARAGSVISIERQIPTTKEAPSGLGTNKEEMDSGRTWCAGEGQGKAASCRSV